MLQDPWFKLNCLKLFKKDLLNSAVKYMKVFE